MTDQPPPGTPPPGYGPAPTPTLPRPGELVDRFLARLIDYVLLAIVNAALVSALIVGTLMGDAAGFGGIGGGATFAASAVSAILSSALALGYFALMESSRGQTVGKMLLKLRTTGPDGQNPSLEQAIRRNLFTALGILGIIPIFGSLLSAMLSLAAIVLIAIGINNDPVNRQGWHDHFAGETRVWKVG